MGYPFDVRVVATKGTTDMCRKVACRNCGKATWAGCGQHADQVLAGVSSADRCHCTADDHAAAQSARGGLFARLFGR